MSTATTERNLLINNLKGIFGIYSKEFDSCKREWRRITSQNQRLASYEILENLYFRLNVLDNELTRLSYLLDSPRINVSSSHHLQSLKRYLTQDIRGRHYRLLANYIDKISRLQERLTSLKDVVLGVLIPPRG